MLERNPNTNAEKKLHVTSIAQMQFWNWEGNQYVLACAYAVFLHIEDAIDCSRHHYILYHSKTEKYKVAIEIDMQSIYK